MVSGRLACRTSCRGCGRAFRASGFRGAQGQCATITGTSALSSQKRLTRSGHPSLWYSVRVTTKRHADRLQRVLPIRGNDVSSQRRDCPKRAGPTYERPLSGRRVDRGPWTLPTPRGDRPAQEPPGSSPNRAVTTTDRMKIKTPLRTDAKTLDIFHCGKPENRPQESAFGTAVSSRRHLPLPPRFMNFFGLAPVQRNMARVNDD